MKKAGIIAGLFFARHPGAGRDPVAKECGFAEGSKAKLFDAFTPYSVSLLDSGLRRNDERNSVALLDDSFRSPPQGRPRHALVRPAPG